MNLDYRRKENKVMKSYKEALNDMIKYWFPIIMSLSEKECVSLEKAFKERDLEKIKCFLNNNGGIKI